VLIRKKFLKWQDAHPEFPRIVFHGPPQSRDTPPPLKSYPVYAAVGYDVADFFLPQQAFNHDNYLAVPQQATPQLQIDVELLREPSGGFLNDTGYMIRYSPLRYVEKIRID